MSKITHAATRAAFGTAIDGVLKYVSRDRKEHMMKLVDLSEKFLGDTFRQQTYDGARNLILEDGKWMQFIDRALSELDPHVLKTTALNLGFEAGFAGFKKTRELSEKLDTNIPWIILMDPTAPAISTVRGAGPQSTAIN